MSKYIKEDKFRALMYHKAFEEETELQKWDSGCWIRYKLFEQALDEMPSADVVEVKHGEWVKSNPLTDTFECSLCGMQIPVPEMCSPFCPLCGAEMRERKETE